jgi:acyl carrier protein phosphodiesterase
VNYLAHAYLSFRHPELVVGNMISDFVKGRKQYDYPPGIFKGIKLHRAIDEFTDAHPATQEAKHFFRPAYRLYAGALVDVVFDYYLAHDSAIFPDESHLAKFAASTYQQLNTYIELLPTRFEQMLPYMQRQNWLLNYRTKEGIRQSLGGVVRRSVYLTEAETAFLLFNEHCAELKRCYEWLFPELVMLSEAFIGTMDSAE